MFTAVVSEPAPGRRVVAVEGDVDLASCDALVARGIVADVLRITAVDRLLGAAR